MKMSAMAEELFITGFSSGIIDAMRFPSSTAASISHALALPIPLIRLSSSGLHSARYLMPLLSMEMMSAASSMADLPPLPLPIRIARISIFDSFSLPSFNSFSLGFSPSGSFLIFIFPIPFSFYDIVILYL